MKKTNFKIFFIASLLLILATGRTALAQTTPNLVANSGLENASTSPSQPAGWLLGGWGTNTRSSEYPVAGRSGKGAKVSISSFTDGDTKWYFDMVPVTSGSLYSYSDWYKSDVQSTLIAAYQMSDGTNRYATLSSLPSSNGAWTNASQQFTPPVGAVKVTMFHVIASVGSLTIDDVSLSLASAPSGNLFPKGVVSITFDDGWSSQYENALPVLASNNLKATFYITTKPMQEASFDYFTDPNQAIQATSSTNGASWTEIYLDPTVSQYRFTDFYTASSPSTLRVTYDPLGPTGPLTVVVGTAPTPVAGVQRMTQVFPVPARDPGTPVTISHTADTGVLAVLMSPKLNPYSSGYISGDQVVDLKNMGHEVGAHSVYHCNMLTLPSITNCAFVPAGNTTTPNQEITDSKNALVGLGLTNVNTYAYPNGAQNQTIQNILASNGFAMGRTIDPGYVTRQSNPRALPSQVIETNMSLSRFQDWIDYAANNKVWVILTYHDISPGTVIGTTDGAVSTQLFSQMMSYIAAKQSAPSNSIVVKTVQEMIPEIGPIIPPIITGPDTQRPLPVTGLTASNITNSSFTFSWSPAIDPLPSSGINHYEIYGPNKGSCHKSVNGSAGYCGSVYGGAISMQITGLTPGTYSGSSGSFAGFTVRAVDNAGNYSPSTYRLTVVIN